MKVVCVGDCGIDHYLPSAESTVGGITANVACHARCQFRNDDEIVVVSCLGDDDNAARVRDEFDDGRIRCLWNEVRGQTPVQYIEVQPDGERQFLRYEAGVLSDFEFSAEQREAIASGDVLIAPVYLQIVGLYTEVMAIATAGLTAIDFADFLEHPDFTLLEEHIQQIDVGFFGLSPQATREIDRIATLAAEHDKRFIVTLGAAGSVAFDGTRRIECAAVRVDRVADTTGAGDAYAAAFLSRYCHGATVDGAMEHAAKVAAGVVTQMGSFSAYDVAEEAW